MHQIDCISEFYSIRYSISESCQALDRLGSFFTSYRVNTCLKSIVFSKENRNFAAEIRKSIKIGGIIMNINKEEAIKRIKILLQHKKEMKEKAELYLKQEYQLEFGQA
ncbi:MAG: hypothetical protein UE783_08305 [Prevotella sp.]|nr:hypothetical protein [uncultured Prevotella sp.]MED9898157.1 hypothetical protein [Prevotella sp.]